MLALKEGIENLDNKKILEALTRLRKLSKGRKINKETFELLVELIKMPNEKILNYALSILANSCLHDKCRKMFRELGGIPHIMVIVNSVTSSSIICRACRLMGNIALDQDIVKELNENDASLLLIKLIEKHEAFSPDALGMAFRALRKVWLTAQIKWQVVPKDMMSLVTKCLNSEDEQLMQMTLETLALITNYKDVPKKNKLEITQEFFLKLISLAKNKVLKKNVIICLSNLICFETSSIWKFLEGSSIGEIYIEYMENNNNVAERVYKAFYRLCTEGGIRSKVRLSGFLPKLINSCDSKNTKVLLATFSLFQYDLISMKVCSENPKFVSLLVSNITQPGSIEILAVLSRLTPPVKELVSSKNLDVIISSKKCNRILKNIASTTGFLKPLILSGKIWKIEKAGCKMENMCSPGYVEYLLTQLLTHLPDQKSKEEVSLAAPFLIEARNFKLLQKLLIQYEAMGTILNLLKKDQIEEKVTATIVRLITIFRCNYHTPENFFQDLMGGGTPPFLNDYTTLENSNVINDVTSKNSDISKSVVFEFEDGECLSVDKNLVCSKSPVLNSMLNGYFVEARQDKISLKKCSSKSFTLLVDYLHGKKDFCRIEMETYLELLSLSDRFMLFELNKFLTENLKINTSGCSIAYKWFRQAGHTVNNRKIGQLIYEFIFSSTEGLLATLKDETCRISLISDISHYFLDTFRDL